MRVKSLGLVLAVSISIVLSSCVSKKKLTYLQYSEAGKKLENELIIGNPQLQVSSYKILPYDNLFIRVITPDPQWSELFNVMPVGAGGAVTEESASLFGYPVDLEGNIEIPYVGLVQVAGKSLNEIKATLDSIFKNYVSDAAITVRLVNNSISILGEVNAPGKYPLSKERINIFDALSMAGDLTGYSNRRRVQLIRPSPYGPIVKEFSLTDRSILSSEFYYVMPNDILYAQPLQGRLFQLNSSVWTLFLTTLTSTLGVIGFIRTL